MRKFEMPMIKTESLEIADVITTSQCEKHCGEHFELPE